MAEPAVRPRLTVAVLFRATLLLAVGLGCTVGSVSGSPSAMVGWMASIGAILAVIVGRRRRGTRQQKLSASVGFFVGFFSVAAYCAYIGAIVQVIGKSADPMDAVHSIFALLALPTAVVLFLYTLRAWTWSAHDQSEL